ncbi:MAG: DUF1254 domain-containing protein [Pseudomonadota bacterium]
MVKTPRRVLFIVFIAIVGWFTFGVQTVVAARIEKDFPTGKIQAIAQEAYIYGLQQVVFYETRYGYTQLESAPQYVGINRLWWLRQPITPAFRQIVTPNATTLYGSGFFDLSEEPLVVELPAIKDRYYSFQTMDQYGDYFFYAGNQFTGTGAQKYILIGPGWKGQVPAEFKGIEIIQAPSNAGFMIMRIALKSYAEDEVHTVNGYQDQVTTTPLKEWVAKGKKGVPYDKRAKVKGNSASFSGMDQLTEALVEKQTAMDYFRLLSLVLNDSTMTKRQNSLKELGMLERLAKIGLGEGSLFNPVDLSQAQKEALEKGFSAGKQEVKSATRNSLSNMNGWMLTKDMGRYGTDYLVRAVIADAGWAGPEAKSHTGAICFADAAGKQLNGKNRYTLTFDTKNLPPVTEFWSIPIYDIQGYFVDNKIKRYTVNSFMLERGEFSVDKDGRLTFYIQHEEPKDPSQKKNWLPAPQGDFRFAARFYGPYAPLIYGTYKMPLAQRVD